MATATVERVTVRPDDKDVRFAARPPGGEAYQPLLHEPPPHGEVGPTTEELQRRTLLSSGINLSKAIMGVGILALPRVFSLLGIGTATLWLAFIALLSYASMHMLTKATARTGLANYSDLVKDRLGLFAQAVHDLSIIANCFGMMVVYLVVIGDVLVGEGKAEGLLSEDCGDRRTVLAVVTLLLLAPLVSATRTRATVGASALGVAAVLIWAAITLMLFLLAASNGQLHHMHWWPTSGTFKSKGFESAVQMVGVLPILVVAYLCQMSLGHTSREVAYASERQLDNVSIVAVSLSTVAFLVISVCSYGIFGAKGLRADVLSSFTVKALQPIVWTRLAQACFMLVRLGFLVSLLAMFPLQMAPFRDSLWKLLFRQELQASQ
ncbi:hypothetical protein COHA_003238 [Chlorella ohadii]|uniref:Amino acid transporter transmembrane domain-containing protein n=2 Tax=Chlorella ohadii TaxID=2649997 RepID=A0AAD5H405_9CHLO|nr:hypothetical protein COHA_003238 [Chlorella ohadii]